MRDPTGDRERRPENRRRFILISGGLILAAIVAWAAVAPWP